MEGKEVKYIEINKMRLSSASGITSLINNIYFHLTNPDYEVSEITLIMGKRPQYFPPFCMLFLALSIKQMKSTFEVPITFSDYDEEWLGYAAHMGFFQLSGFDFGKKIGEAKGGKNYLPLISLEVPDANIDIDEIHASEVERMQDIGDDLARRLLKLDRGDAFDTLSYLCREILRNVIEHSYSDHMYYCAQYYPNKNIVEVVVADEGEGVLEGLNQNPKLNLVKDKDAIKFAILPGMSGRSHKYMGRRAANHIYANSGYGLYLTHKICSNAGKFLMISNSHGISISNERIVHLPKVDFEGTIVRLTIDISKVNGIADMIDTYRTTAEEIMATNSKLDEIPPSAASMMLRL